MLTVQSEFLCTLWLAWSSHWLLLDVHFHLVLREKEFSYLISQKKHELVKLISAFWQVIFQTWQPRFVNLKQQISLLAGLYLMLSFYCLMLHPAPLFVKKLHIKLCFFFFPFFSDSQMSSAGRGGWSCLPGWSTGWRWGGVNQRGAVCWPHPFTSVCANRHINRLSAAASQKVMQHASRWTEIIWDMCEA